MLDEVKFGSNGWPTINNGSGPSISATSPFGSVQKHSQEFQDPFRAVLLPGWEWPQDQEPRFVFPSKRTGGIELGPKARGGNDLLDAVLARSTRSGSYTATTVVKPSSGKAGAMAGIAAIGDTGNAAGLAVGAGKLVLWRRDGGKQKTLVESNGPRSDPVYLKLDARRGSSFQFAYSTDGKEWTAIGEPQSGEQFPPWDRSVRVGLTASGGKGAGGRFVEFRMVEAR